MDENRINTVMTDAVMTNKKCFLGSRLTLRFLQDEDTRSKAKKWIREYISLDEAIRDIFGSRRVVNTRRKGNVKITDMYHNRFGYKGTAGNVRMGKSFHRFQSSDRSGMDRQSSKLTDTGADVTERITKESPRV